MRIWTRKSASIQPRTSLGKSAVSGSDMRLQASGGGARLGACGALARAGGVKSVVGSRACIVVSPSPLHGHDTITLSEARSRLDRRRFSRPRPHFLAFFKIYKKITFSRANSGNFCQKIGKFCKNFDIFWQILQNFAKFSEIRKNFAKFCRIFCRILQKCVDFEKC